ncbi:MAG TPA: ABATE domain-containing protein [Terriglobales bacterium]|jgi:predicted RNA-binding Zn ribbon-like protein|nr:ABATE domain-containing protein [Terriglobales bacterium]
MKSRPYQYRFVAGNLSLDFVNTVAYRFHPEKLEDHLESEVDLRRWAHQARLPDLRAIHRSPGMSRKMLRRIREVREQLFAIFHAIARGAPIPADALRRIEQSLRHCCARRTLAAHGAKVRWIWRPEAGGSDFLLYPVLTAAAALLTSGARGLVRQCADAECGWLFLDRSHAGQRRWCRMADCGNRNKAREHYRRHKRRPNSPRSTK